jgi:cell division septation protein DedD
MQHNMANINNKWFWKTLLIGRWILTTPISAQQPSGSRVKDFLNRQDFLELIQKYRMDTISLQREGLVRDSVARLNDQMQPGFRGQVVAGSVQKNAQQVYQRLQSSRFSPVYLIQTPDGLYKVQVGDFQERTAAENMMLKLFKAGFKNVWLVQTDVRVPRKPAASSSGIEKAAHRASKNEIIYYGIQVLATGDSAKAHSLQSELQNKFSYPVSILKKDHFYKLIIGKFEDRIPAEGLLKMLREKGFEDAWITQIQK